MSFGRDENSTTPRAEPLRAQVVRATARGENTGGNAASSLANAVRAAAPALNGVAHAVNRRVWTE